MKGKAKTFTDQLREAKQKLKSETEMKRRLLADVKQKHLEILKLEEKQKMIQDQIRGQKEKGLSPRSSKLTIEREL